MMSITYCYTDNRGLALWAMRVISKVQNYPHTINKNMDKIYKTTVFIRAGTRVRQARKVLRVQKLRMHSFFKADPALA